MWGIGCIFAEMCTGRPLFCGASDVDQLHKIIKVIGTPSKTDWPGQVDCPEYQNKFRPIPVYEGKKLKAVVPRLGKVGLDLLERMLQPDPTKRITAREGMKHPFFADLKGAQS